jgi:glycosyltransferase involved in cell wall biosynthesis
VEGADPPAEVTMPQRLLLDIGPTAGGHGARGIGSYVRGLIEAIGDWPPERRQLVWALALPGATLPIFEGRTVCSRLLSIRPVDLGWVLRSPATGRAIRVARANVLHATDPQRPTRLRGIRQVVTAYDLIPLREPGMLNSWQPHHRHAYRLYLDQLRRADVIVAISKATATDLSERLGISEDRVSIVYPVVRTPRAAERAPAAEPTFLCVGALDSHKQPELAIAALAEFRRVHAAGRLRFIGPSASEQQARLGQQATSLGVAESVCFEGRVSDEELDRAFATATALLSTSRIEGFGLPGVEAVLRGVPLIAVDTAAARETVGSAAILVPSDAGAIAEAMAAPAPIPESAREIMAARFSRQSAAAALWVAYEQILV